MEIKISDITSLVKDEVIKLKKLITLRQISNLNLSNRITENVYDQLTGSSENVQAINLLNRCSKPYSSDLMIFKSPNQKNFNYKQKIPVFSPLEIFCWYATNAQLEIVHKYLKNEVSEIYFGKFISSLKLKK